MRIPFCPLPFNKAKSVSRPFHGLAWKMVKSSKTLKLNLELARIPLNAIEYMSIALFSAFFMFAVVFGLIFVVMLTVQPVVMALAISAGLAAVIFIVTLLYIRTYPRMIIRKRVKDVERNIIYGLRHIYIQIKSGVPLFESLVWVSQNKYGAFSDEIKQVVQEVNAGKPLEIALEDSATKNPSAYFRRSIWHISNGVKAGGDIGGIVQSIIDNMTAQQRIEVRKFGSQLNPLSLIFMMVAVIMPTLGVTFLMVLSTFGGIEVTEMMFWVIIAGVVLFEFMFLGMIKSKRPNII